MNVQNYMLFALEVFVVVNSLLDLVLGIPHEVNLKECAWGSIFRQYTGGVVRNLALYFNSCFEVAKVDFFCTEASHRKCLVILPRVGQKVLAICMLSSKEGIQRCWWCL